MVVKQKEPEPPDGRTDVPLVTVDQMREVDRLMMEDYGIALVQMAESAGRNLAHLARQRFLGGDPRGCSVLVLAGPGGNGAGGLVCARRLHNWGAQVLVWLATPASLLAEVTGHHYATLERMGVRVDSSGAEPALPTTDLAIDALIGYGLRGAPDSAAAGLIRACLSRDGPVLSLDVPSGIDATTGAVHEPAVRATATMTLALPKRGLASEEARPYVGDLYLADIGVPPELYASPSLGVDVGPVFARDDIVRLRQAAAGPGGYLLASWI